jgi:putative peptidoglycan lipid II flippase
MLVTFSSVFSNVVLSLVLMRALSFAGLALATSLAFTFSALIGSWRMGRITGQALEVFTLPWMLKLMGSLGTMGVFLFLSGYLWPYSPEMVFGGRLAWILLNISVGMLSYGLVSFYLGSDEWNWIRAAISNRDNDRR